MKKNGYRKAGGALLAAALTLAMTSAAFAGTGSFGGSQSQGNFGNMQSQGNFGNSQNTSGYGAQNFGTQNFGTQSFGIQDFRQQGTGETGNTSAGKTGNTTTDENVPEAKDAAPAVDENGKALEENTQSSGTMNGESGSSLEELIRAIINAILNNGNNTQNAAQEQNGQTSENRQMPEQAKKAGEDIEGISNAISSVTDSDTKSSLEALLTAYTDALTAEKTALDDTSSTEDTLSGLRSDVASARDALMNAMKEAGIELPVPELPDRAPATSSDAQ